jgi:hypothetical protein
LLLAARQVKLSKKYESVLGLKLRTLLAAEMELIVASSLVYWPKLFVLSFHREKSSILRVEEHAARTPEPYAAARPIIA